MNGDPHPYPQNLRILPHTAKYVIKIRMLTGEAYLGLSRWALNPTVSVLIRVMQKEI